MLTCCNGKSMQHKAPRGGLKMGCRKAAAPKTAPRISPYGTDTTTAVPFRKCTNSRQPHNTPPFISVARLQDKAARTLLTPLAGYVACAQNRP